MIVVGCSVSGCLFVIVGCFVSGKVVFGEREWDRGAGCMDWYRAVEQKVIEAEGLSWRAFWTQYLVVGWAKVLMGECAVPVEKPRNKSNSVCLEVQKKGGVHAPFFESRP